MALVALLPQNMSFRTRIFAISLDGLHPAETEDAAAGRNDISGVAKHLKGSDIQATTGFGGRPYSVFDP